MAVPDELRTQYPNVSSPSIVSMFTREFGGGGGGRPELAQGRLKELPDPEQGESLLKRYIRELEDER